MIIIFLLGYYQTRVLYILLNSNNINDKYATNADLTEISYFKHEKEILLFPFSFYEINKIENKNNYYEIYLNYLGKYRKSYHIADQCQLLNLIPKSDFINEFESLGLLKSIWKTRKSLCRIVINNIYCSGFLCSIHISDSKSIRVLITISIIFRNLEFLKDKNNYINVVNDGSYHKIIFGNRKIYNSRDYKTTIIEIKPDEFQRKPFLELDEKFSFISI